MYFEVDLHLSKVPTYSKANAFHRVVDMTSFLEIRRLTLDYLFIYLFCFVTIRFI